MRKMNASHSETSESHSGPTVISFDLEWSLAAAIVAFALGMSLGGFSFFTPWLIVIPVVMFAAGFLRGGSAGRIIGRGLALSTFLLILLLITSVNSPLNLLPGIPIIVAPAVAGIAARHNWSSLSRIRST